jgi:hypothetical protein
MSFPYGSFKPLISKREEYVQSLEARLATVETRLDKQPAPSTTPTYAPASKPASSLSPTGSSEPGIDVSPSPVGRLYEGSSSFINQFVQASKEIQQSAVAETPEAAQTLSESFNRLNSILHDQEEKKPSVAAITRSVPEISPLPASIVLAIIRKIKGIHPSTPLKLYD